MNGLRNSSNVLRPRLRRSLLAVIVIKVLFLTAFWALVLKPQIHHVDAEMMQQKLISQSVPQPE